MLLLLWFFGQEACRILAPEIWPVPPALEGEVPTTGWPGSPLLRESDSCSQDLWWLIPFPWRESWKTRPHYLSTWLPGTSCLLKINGVSPAWELRGLLASFLHQECKIARCTQNQIQMRPISLALAPWPTRDPHHTEQVAWLPLGTSRDSLRQPSHV